jgi:hypothetical protein
MNDKPIFLRNNNLYHEMMQYSPGNGNMKIIKHRDDIKISGFYSIVSEEMFMLYKANNNLFLRVNDAIVPLSDKSLSISFERVDKNNRVIIKLGSQVIYFSLYLSCIYDPVNMADIDFNCDKEEDLDFLLFLNNIIHSKERQELSLEVWN